MRYGVLAISFQLFLSYRPFQAKIEKMLIEVSLLRNFDDVHQPFLAEACHVQLGVEFSQIC